MLLIKNLTVNPLFSNIDLTIKNWIIGILWPSGSWKTTFLKAIWWFIKPDKWEISYIENNIQYYIKQWKLYPENKNTKIWIHFQNYNLLELDVKDNINLSFILNWYKKDINWISKLLDYFEIKDLTNKNIEKISWWEKERVSIVKALVTKPKILLLDEAGSALDNRLKNKLYAFLTDYSKNNIVFLVSHDKEIIKFFELKGSIYQGNFNIYYNNLIW
jgi:ABC-type lipoprotein export system ATPase subunit